MKTILSIILEVILFIGLFLFAKVCMPNGASYVFYVLEKRCVLTNEIFVGITFLLAVFGTAILFSTAAQENTKIQELEKRNRELEMQLDDKTNEADALLAKVGTLEIAIEKAINR